MNDGFVRRRASRQRHFLARFLLLASPEIDKNHQHARFNQPRINRQCLGKGNFSTLVILGATKTFENPIDVRSSKPIKREREVWIKVDGPLEVFNGRVAIFLSDGAKNKTRKEVASTQVLFVGRRVLRGWFRDTVLLRWTELETQP